MPVYVIAYRASGDKLYVSDQYVPGDATRYLQFPAGAVMAPYTSGTNANIAFTQPMTMGLSSLIPLSQFPADYAQVVNGTIGQAQFPAYEIHGSAGRLYDTLFVVDTLRWWLQCAACKYSFATTLSPSPGANIVSGPLYFLNPLTLVGSLPTAGILASTTPPAGTDLPLGIAVLSAISPQEPNPGVAAWLEWHQLILRRLQTSILPAAPTQFVGTPLALTHQVNAALLPSSVNYNWDFGDQTPKVTVANNPATTHTYTATGTYTVTGQIIDNRNNQVIAQSTTQVTVVVSSIQFTVAGGWDQTFTPPDGSYGYTDGDGQRGNQAFPGLDVVLLSYDNGSNTSGVTVILFLPTGTNFTVGQLFQQRSNGAAPSASVFGLILAQNLNDLANSSQSNIGAGGTLTITSVTKTSDGATVFGYSINTSNGTGGSVLASGYGRVP